SCAFPREIARDPGTTTAPAGTSNGWSPDDRYTCSRTMSNSGVDRVRIVPAPSTARSCTIVPSYTPQFPPTSTSSSITTGVALIGSSTPPTWAAALKCTRFPTCAHDPTSACESIIVPSSTYAPTFTYIGGMHTTEGARYAPSRTVEPPGTTRTRCSGEKCRTGYVSLSTNE